MEIETTLEEADVIAFHDFLSRENPVFRRADRSVAFMSPIPVLCFGFTFYLDAPEGAKEPILWFFISLAIAFPFIVLKGLKWLRDAIVVKVNSRAQRASVYGPQRYVVDENAITRFNKSGHAAYYWHAIENVGATTDYIFIWTGPTQAFVIPKRDFTSKSDLDEFSAIVEEHFTRTRGVQPTE